MLKDKILLSIIPPLGYLLINIIGKTIKWEKLNYDSMINFKNSQQPIIFAFWHGRLLMMPYLNVGKNPHVMISQHRDGELISRIIKYFSISSFRGSTTRGGKEGFKKLVKHLKSGFDAVIAPDGPQGPPYKAQHGIIRLASITRCSILPITYSTSRFFKMKSWDEFMVPKPFSKGIFIVGDTIEIPANATKDILEEKRVELEIILNKITLKADKAVSKKNRDN